MKHLVVGGEGYIGQKLVSDLINEPLRLEDMGKNALEASGYAQLRADEASEHLLSIFNNKWLHHVFFYKILVQNRSKVQSNIFNSLPIFSYMDFGRYIKKKIFKSL